MERSRSSRCTGGLLLALALLFTASVVVAETKPPHPAGEGVVKKQPEAQPGWTYSWASKRLAEPYWGIAVGEIDEESGEDVALLERKAVHIGSFADQKFTEKVRCELTGLAQGARISLIDLDGDGRDEIVVSAVEDGLPTSEAIELRDGKCGRLFANERLSLRAVDDVPGSEGKRLLLGQAWSSDDFFSGPILELFWDGKKLKKERRIDIPRYVDLFSFAFLPPDGDFNRVVTIKGFAPLEVWEKGAGRWKRLWRSGERMGGGNNVLEAKQRAILGEVSSDQALFVTAPMVIHQGSQETIVALRHDMPLRGMIGKQPLVRGAELVAFVPDEAILFRETQRTPRLPGAIGDVAIAAQPGGGVRLYGVMQDDPSMFRGSDRSVILGFDLR